MLKQWVLVVAAIAFLALFLLSLVPFLVNAETFKPEIEGQISGALGREVTLAHISYSVFGGSLTAHDISIADDPTFSSVPFIQAKALELGIETLPFLFRHQVRITRLTIDSPSIQLIQKENGKWNFSSIGGSTTTPSSTQQSSSTRDLTVEELKISNGSATVSSIPMIGSPFQYSNVSVTVNHFSFLQSVPFQLSAKLPAEGSLKLAGNAGPISQKNTMQTPFKARLELRNLDPVASGIIAKGKGIAMQDDIDAQLQSDGVNVSSTGKVKATGLQLVPSGSPAQDPVNIDYAISHNLNTRRGTVSDVAVHVGSAAAAHVTGTFQVTAQTVLLDLHLAASTLPIDPLEQLLPVVGIRLPKGSSLRGGTLTANIAVTGPATAATLAGPVEIDSTKLEGFDLGSKIEGMNPLGGTSSGTEIRVLKADVTSSPEGAKISNIFGDLPQIGSAAGAGTVAPTGAINFNLTAKINSSNPVGALANTAVNAVGGILGGFLHPNAKPSTTGQRGIPITITGTATSPSIRANIGAMLR
jgi:AsmA protein